MAHRSILSQRQYQGVIPFHFMFATSTIPNMTMPYLPAMGNALWATQAFA